MAWYDFMYNESVLRDMVLPSSTVQLAADLAGRGMQVRVDQARALATDIAAKWPHAVTTYKCGEATRAAKGLGELATGFGRALGAFSEAFSPSASLNSQLRRQLDEIVDYTKAVTDIVVAGCKGKKGSDTFASTQLRAYVINGLQHVITGLELLKQGVVQGINDLTLREAFNNAMELIYEGLKKLGSLVPRMPFLGIPDWLKYATLGLTGWWIYGKVKG